MPRKQKKYHYLYKTTNLINNKFYVGMHSTDDLKDGYLGSGKRLRYSINKHGEENFKIEFLEFFDTRKELKEREENYVNEKFLKTPMCMNLRTGGYGGFYSIEACTKGGVNAGLARIKKFKEDPEFAQRHKDRMVLQNAKLWAAGKFECPNWTGKKHKEESKKKIGKANSIKQLGEMNSQFGTCWVYNDKENKKIKKTNLASYLNEGWNKGRKFKKTKISTYV